MRLFWGILLMAAGVQALHADVDRLQKHLLVVYNRNLKESEELARYYAQKRSIPEERILGIACPVEEEITRAVYREQVAEPIDEYLVKKGWIERKPVIVALDEKTKLTVQGAVRNDIWAMVLMRGIPLKIAHDPTLQEPAPKTLALNTNAAAVDSELATLPVRGLPMAGVQINTYSVAGQARDFDFLDGRQMILVTRLDGPVAADVRRMIDDSLWAEENRLTGRAYVDARGLTNPRDGYYQGDVWLNAAAETLRKNGWPVEFDNQPVLFPASQPWSQVGIYFGWYEGTAQGPFMGTARVFSRGAVAYHIHSFSAATVRSDKDNWAGPLIGCGAAATMGAVYEPYLDLTPHVDVFIDRLLQGYTFAESAYMSQRALSWMSTMIGDPLYRPFKQPLSAALAKAREDEQSNLEWLELQAVRIGTGDRRAVMGKLASARGSTNVAWEAYGDLLSGTLGGAGGSETVFAYERAMALSLTAVDQIRIGVKAAKAFAHQRRWTDCYRILEKLVQRWPGEATTYAIGAEVKKFAAQSGPAPLPVSLHKYVH
jgi:uncharacterized protein (TIGR03790 family)